MSARVLAAVQSPPPPPPLAFFIQSEKARYRSRGESRASLRDAKIGKRILLFFFEGEYTRGDWDRAVDSCWREEEEEEEVTFFINITV